MVGDRIDTAPPDQLADLGMDVFGGGRRCHLCLPEPAPVTGHLPMQVHGSPNSCTSTILCTVASAAAHLPSTLNPSADYLPPGEGWLYVPMVSGTYPVIMRDRGRLVVPAELRERLVVTTLLPNCWQADGVPQPPKTIRRSVDQRRLFRRRPCGTWGWAPR
jgi:hypothetical protein